MINNNDYKHKCKRLINANIEERQIDYTLEKFFCEQRTKKLSTAKAQLDNSIAESITSIQNIINEVSSLSSDKDVYDDIINIIDDIQQGFSFVLEDIVQTRRDLQNKYSSGLINQSPNHILKTVQGSNNLSAGLSNIIDKFKSTTTNIINKFNGKETLFKAFNKLISTLNHINTEAQRMINILPDYKYISSHCIAIRNNNSPQEDIDNYIKQLDTLTNIASNKLIDYSKQITKIYNK